MESTDVNTHAPERLITFVFVSLRRPFLHFLLGSIPKPLPGKQARGVFGGGQASVACRVFIIYARAHCVQLCF